MRLSVSTTFSFPESIIDIATSSIDFLEHNKQITHPTELKLEKITQLGNNWRLKSGIGCIYSKNVRTYWRFYTYTIYSHIHMRSFTAGSYERTEYTVSLLQPNISAELEKQIGNKLELSGGLQFNFIGKEYRANQYPNDIDIRWNQLLGNLGLGFSIKNFHTSMQGYVNFINSGYFNNPYGIEFTLGIDMVSS